MNIGSAVRSHEFDAVHIDVASTCPAGVATFVSTGGKAAHRQCQRDPDAGAEDREQQQHQEEGELEYVHGSSPPCPA